MIEGILASFQIYYGLDWAALGFGMCGFYMVTNRNRYGFLLSIIGCLCGFCVSSMSSQYGFVLYNIILICLQSRGYILWTRAAREQALQAAE